MQVYRHMEAGTAKPAASLRARAPHHLIDIVEPTERFTVADWLARADALIVELTGKSVRPIVVGGTNLYLKSLLEGLFDGPAMDAEFRALAADRSGAQLHEELARVDPGSAGRIHPNDHKKLVRALEVFHATGRPISTFQTQWGKADTKEETPAYRHDPILLGLNWPTEVLNRRINARVKLMFYPEDSGVESLPDEVRRLESNGRLGPQAREALGYKQVLEHLQGHCSMEEAFERTKILTRRFAKTQRTWLRRYRGIHWLDAAALTPQALAHEAGRIVSSDPQA